MGKAKAPSQRVWTGLGVGLLLIALFLTVPPEPSHAAAADYLVTQSVTGGPGNDTSYSATLSDDGRLVWFQSYATDLVSKSPQNGRGVFVRDLATDTTQRIDVGGIPAYDLVAVSRNGRFAIVSVSHIGGSTLYEYDRDAGTATSLAPLSDRTSDESLGLGGVSNDGRTLFASWSLMRDGRVLSLKCPDGTAVPYGSIYGASLDSTGNKLLFTSDRCGVAQETAYEMNVESGSTALIYNGRCWWTGGNPCVNAPSLSSNGLHRAMTLVGSLPNGPIVSKLVMDGAVLPDPGGSDVPGGICGVNAEGSETIVQFAKGIQRFVRADNSFTPVTTDHPGGCSPNSVSTTGTLAYESDEGQVYVAGVGPIVSPSPTPVGNRAPAWSSDTPKDGSRFDVVSGSTKSFHLAATDSDGDPLTITSAYKTPSGRVTAVPNFLHCDKVAKPGQLSLDCLVAPKPGNSGLRVMTVSVSDAAGASTAAREYLVGGSLLQYVALGDSYSAGEGVDPYFRDGYKAGTTGPVDNRCHRSSRAYAEQVQMPGAKSPLYAIASGGGAPGTGAKTVNKYGSDSNVRYSRDAAWVFWACSGALMPNVLPETAGGKVQNEDRHLEQFTQLDNDSVNYATDVVTISIGGNDATFADTLFNCYKGSCYSPTKESILDAAIDGLRPQLEKVYRAVLKKTFNAKVLVLGYPQLMPASSAEQTCLKLHPFLGEMDFIRRSVARTNTVIQQAALAAGVTYVDATSAFSGHEVCGSKSEWINGPSVTYKKSKNFTDDESFHPTLEGQRQYAQLVNRSLADARP